MSNKRYKKGVLWKFAFYLSTLVAITFLILLILNIINSAFGYVVIENSIEPEKLAENGQSLEEMEREQLIGVLEEHLSKGLIRRFNYEEPLAERSETELLRLVYERVVSPEIVKSWNLLESMLGKDDIQTWRDTHAPQGIVEFR